ncbi:MAG TPA: hypothetical protein VKV15_27555 [Bryobacteraceae bacterium]|nr:hypothetical protein [Bryobacteraceae bacterium]
MHFTFTGFHQTNNIRQFQFEALAPDRTRSTFLVHADLTLLRKYHISLQDAPLLCLQLLETTDEAALSLSVMFSEEDMRKHDAGRIATREAALLKKKQARTAIDPQRLGPAWRSKPQP